jgi:PAS domain S-box-containing protein
MPIAPKSASVRPAHAVPAALGTLAVALLLAVAVWIDDGSRAWLAAAGMAVAAAGFAAAWLTQWRADGGERQQVAAALNERRLLLESVDVTPAPFALYDAEDRLVACNASYRELHEPAFSQLPGPIHYRDLMTAVARRLMPEDKIEATVRERVAAHHQADGTAIDRQYPNGRWLRVSKMRTRSGAVAGFASDVTELKRREADLMASEARLRDFAETASDWFWETDSELRLFFVSNLPEMAGFDPRVWVGRSLIELAATPGTQDSRVAAYCEILRRREPFRDFTLELKADANIDFYIALSAKPIHAADGSFIGYRGVGRDVTSTITAAKALQNALEQAEEASLSKSAFLASMSHELRTPLNAIIGFSDVVRSGMVPGNDTQRYVAYAADIHQSGLHLLELINDLLDLSKIEAGKMDLHEERIDMPEMLADLMRMLKDQAERGSIAMELRCDAELRHVMADERSIRQIVINLISNGIKFTPAGGSVRIDFTRRRNGMLRITVSDTGIGIAPEDMPKLMQPFYQVDSPYGRKQKGTGLGLTLVRTLAELQGGTVTVESTPGEGTTVSVDLPAWRALTPERRAGGAS